MNFSLNNQHTSSTISHIKTKYSYGYDGISPVLLKLIINNISPSGTLTLLKGYSTNRKQYCDYKGTNSNMLLLHKGVPQGSILGPLMFILYVNDFYLSSNKFTFLMHAEDTTILSTYDTFYTNTDR